MPPSKHAPTKLRRGPTAHIMVISVVGKSFSFSSPHDPSIQNKVSSPIILQVSLVTNKTNCRLTDDENRVYNMMQMLAT